MVFIMFLILKKQNNRIIGCRKIINTLTNHLFTQNKVFYMTLTTKIK